MRFEEIKTPEELLEFMDVIKYGFETLDGKKCIEESDFEKNILNWTLSSPERLLSVKLGHCFDQVELERDWFFKNNYNIKTYFMIFLMEEKNNYPTHTFLTYEKNNKWYLFEHADYYNRGIHEFNSLEELLESAKKRQIKYANVSDDIKEKLTIFEYDKPEYNIGFIDFINRIVEEGRKC